MDAIGAVRGTWEDMEDLMGSENETVQVPLTHLKELICIAVENTDEAIHHGGEYFADKYGWHDDRKFAVAMQAYYPETEERDYLE